MAATSPLMGYLKLSLVTCAVAMVPAQTDREKTRFHTLNKETGNRLRMQWIDSETGDVVEVEDRTRGYEYAKGEHIIVEDEDFDLIALEAVARSMSISSHPKTRSTGFGPATTTIYCRTMRLPSRRSRLSATRWQRRRPMALPRSRSISASAGYWSRRATRASCSRRCATPMRSALRRPGSSSSLASSRTNGTSRPCARSSNERPANGIRRRSRTATRMRSRRCSARSGRATRSRPLPRSPTRPPSTTRSSRCSRRCGARSRRRIARRRRARSEARPGQEERSMIDHEHYVVVRREGSEWCVFTEDGSVCMPKRGDAIQAAMKFAAEQSGGSPIKIEIVRPDGEHGVCRVLRRRRDSTVPALRASRVIAMAD